MEVYLGRRYNDVLFNYKKRAKYQFQAKKRENILNARGVFVLRDRKYRNILKKIQNFDMKIIN